MQITSQKYKFEPGAMSIVQMGEELIGHPSTAINELVKNGYDADAGNYLVYTHYSNEPRQTFIVLKDDGLGMNSETLFGDWLQPSKSTKRDEDKELRKSKIYNRRYLGSKGIGRLAAMALGKHLTVVTKQAEEHAYNWIRLDRDQFRVEALLKTIEFPGGRIDDFKELFQDEQLLTEHAISPNPDLIELLEDDRFANFIEGTLIIVQDLDDSVRGLIEEEFESVDDLDKTSIFKSLRDLITPLQLNHRIQKELHELGIIDEELKIATGESTFEVFYGINFIRKETGEFDFKKIEPSPILDKYHYRVFGKVVDTGAVVGRYVCSRIEQDSRNENFELSSSYSLSDEDLKVRRIKELDIPEKYQNAEFGEFYFDIRVYDLDGDAKDQIAEVLNASGRREATRILKQYLGLRISKNGFGVKPYGEDEQDWLGLGARRVQMHKVTIGPNQIIGNVFLYSPQNDGLSEKTNREGFFENKAFIAFKKIILGVLEEMGRRRATYRLQHNLGRTIKSKHDRPDTEKFIRLILSKTADERIIEATKQFVEETNTAMDNMEESLSFSEKLASLGTGLELVFHEMAQPIANLGTSNYSLNLLLAQLPEGETKSMIADEVKAMGIATDTLGELQEALRPVIGRSMPKTFKPIDIISKVLYLFEAPFRETEVEVHIKKNLEIYEVKSQEYIFWITFLNIVNNANYWLKKGDRKRIITFEHQTPDTIVIHNTSPQIPEEHLESIFEYGITMKDEKNATGLGLAFTRRMLGTIGWEIFAENWETGPAFFIKRKQDKKN